MHGVEVFRLLQDFLVAEQPFLLAKLNPQLLKGPKYSTTGWALAGLYGSRAFSRHRPSIYRYLRASRSIAGPFSWVPLVARERREVHVYGFGEAPAATKGSLGRRQEASGATGT